MSHTIFAHRGLPTLAPENTLAGFELMQDYGISWFETDIAITADEELVIIHDDFLERTSNVCGEISSTNYKDIKNIDMGSWFSPKYTGQKLPTMTDLITFINKSKINVNLELKGVTGPKGYELSQKLIDKMVDYLTQIDKNVNIIISSFNPILLAKMADAAPNYNYAILFEHHTFYPDWQLIADACNAKIVHLENTGLTKAIIQDIKTKGYDINVYTVNQKDRANELFNWGVDGIFTDIANEFCKSTGNNQ